MIGCDDACQSRSHDFARGCRDDEERETVAIETPLKKLGQSRYPGFQSDASARFHKVFMANTAKLRVVPDEVRELPALLNEVAACEPRDPFLKAADPQQLAQDQTRVIEAQRLIEVGRQQVVSGDGLTHDSQTLRADCWLPRTERCSRRPDSTARGVRRANSSRATHSACRASAVPK